MKFTKHFYIEGQRIVSKLGELGEYQYLLNPKDTLAGGGTIDFDLKGKDLKDAIYANFEDLGLDGAVFTAGKSGKVPYGCLKKYYRNAGLINGGGSTHPDSTDTPSNKVENLQFYYHPDHLGSLSYITDISGEVYQHMEYFPFGETFIEERTDAEYTSYLYNGKELDEETGLYYYGARYYDPRISTFYGVDPMAERYPKISPYAYCANNPIRLVDPDGKLPIIPWLLKAGSGAAADMMAQASMEYLFNPNTKSWGQAFDNVNWWQVGRSGAEGLIPWRTPGGKIGRAAGTALVDVLVNAANNPIGYTSEQAGLDFVTGFIGDLAGGGLGQIINKYGSNAVINGLMDKLGYSATQIRKVTGGFDGNAVRKWYKDNVDAININLDPTESNARSVVNQRNTFKQQARDLMSDQNAAANLPEIQSYEYYYKKAYEQGCRGSDLYKAIMEGGTRTNKSYNKKFGE